MFAGVAKKCTVSIRCTSIISIKSITGMGLGKPFCKWMIYPSLYPDLIILIARGMI